MLQGGHARIPKGRFPVTPITMKSNARISGCGIGISQLYLRTDVIDLDPSPTVVDPSDHFVIATEAKTGTDFVENVMVSDLTIDGSRRSGDVDFSIIGWDPNDPANKQGDAYGLWIRNCRNSIFENLEIIECWTDGVMVSIPFGASAQNPSSNCILNSFIIRGCDRQAVSIVGGDELTLSNFAVENIGQGSTAKPLGAALDIEPGQSTPASNNITVANWVIRNAKQGILCSSVETTVGTQSGISISNVVCEDLNGIQALAVYDTKGVAVNGFSCRDFNPGTPGLGIIFENAVGTASNLNFSKITNTAFAVIVRGSESDMEISNLHVEDCNAACLYVGNNRFGPPPEETYQDPETTSALISNFTFRDVFKDTAIGNGVIVVRSTGDVRLRNGLIRQSQAAEQVQLFSEEVNGVPQNLQASFENCDFGDEIPRDLFRDESTDFGKAKGLTNTWNRQPVRVTTSNFDIRYENTVHIDRDGATTLTLSERSEWVGNELLIRHVGSGTPNITINSSTTVATISTTGGAVLLHRSNTGWFANQF